MQITSFEDYSTRSLVNDTFDDVIEGSCFAQVKPDTVVFPTNLAITFLRCNLDNCMIPKNCTIGSVKGINSTVRRIQQQKDKECWVVDKNNKPRYPVNQAEFIKNGISTNPADIPKSELAETRTITIEKLAAKDKYDRINVIKNEV